MQNRLGAIIAINTSLPTFLGTPAPETVWFGYDHEGNRVKKHLNGSNPTYYLKSGLTPLHELDNRGNYTKTMIHSSAGAAPGNQIAQVDENGTLTYLHQDHLGSTILITDQSGNPTAEYDYDPYGAILGFSELDGQGTDYLYTGQEYDPETELHYYGARYYDDNVGRFVSVDPAAWGNPGGFLQDPQQLNLYSYSRNNPIKYIDPTGQCIIIQSGNCPVYIPPPRLSPAQESADRLLTSMIPIVGDLQDFSEVGSGKDFYTGEQLSEFDKTLTKIGALTPFMLSGRALRSSSDLLSRFFRRSESIADIASRTNWGRAGTLEAHFLEHGSDFGAIDPADYASKAQDFFIGSQRRGLPTKVDQSGVIRIHDPGTNIFGAYNPDGTTRSFFKPTSDTYFERQPGSSPKIISSQE